MLYQKPHSGSVRSADEVLLQRFAQDDLHVDDDRLTELLHFDGLVCERKGAVSQEGMGKNWGKVGGNRDLPSINSAKKGMVSGSRVTNSSPNFLASSWTICRAANRTCKDSRVKMGFRPLVSRTK